MDGRGPYGLACLHCFRGKVKCVAREDGPGCERCFRLHKTCEPSQSVRRRAALENMQSSRIDEMDAKLDTLLDIVQTLKTPSAPLTPEPNNSEDPQPVQNGNPPVQSSPPDQHRASSSQAQSIPTPVLQPSNLMAAYSLANPGTRDLVEALDQFRNSQLIFCPFIYIPQDVEAHKLQQDRPFLCEAILAVTTRSASEKIAWATRIKNTVAQALIVENQSSIDLLFGILTYTSWSQDHFLIRKSTLCRLIELAVSIINDLHWNKPVPLDAHRLTELGGENDWNLRRKVPQVRSPEEKRAVMGAFLLSSFISIYFSESDPMQWTPQMERDLASLEANPEWPGDTALAVHVRLQLLVQNAKQSRDEHATPPHIPFFLKFFRSQLENMRNTLPPHLCQDNIILAQFYYAELSIHETAFTANFVPDFPTPSRSPHSPVGPDAIDCMWHSVLACQRWIAIFLRMLPDGVPMFSITQWAQMGRALVTLYRLSTHPAADWDRHAVCKAVDLVDVVDQIHRHVITISPIPDKPFPDDFWTRGSLLMRAIRDWMHVPARAASVHADEGQTWAEIKDILDAGDPALENWTAHGVGFHSMHNPLQFEHPAIVPSMGTMPTMPHMDTNGDMQY